MKACFLLAESEIHSIASVLFKEMLSSLSFYFKSFYTLYMSELKTVNIFVHHAYILSSPLGCVICCVSLTQPNILFNILLLLFS